MRTNSPVHSIVFMNKMEFFSMNRQMKRQELYLHQILKACHFIQSWECIFKKDFFIKINQFAFLLYLATSCLLISFS